MPRIISATENNIRLNGLWVADGEGVRHARLTNHLNDYLAVNWTGAGLKAELSSATGRKIAVVIKLDEQPISKAEAGEAIQWGEGQSFIFVEQYGAYDLVNNLSDGDHSLKLLTRSDKLICYNFICNEKDT